MKARWLAGEEHLEVVGPAGTKSLLDGLLTFTRVPRRADRSGGPRGVGGPALRGGAGFDVTARETRHSMDGFAYRFSPPSADFDPRTGRRALGDTEAFAGMASFADGSDLLVHDCSFPDGTDVSNHPNPRNWGVARGHRYRHAAALAPVPAHRGREREMAQSVRDAGFDGDVEVASDGLRVAIAERSGVRG